jgi:Cof subfamily protein (haloacid dehalogenase superfamily)
MKIKILFTDLDGTIVKLAGDVTEETVKVAKKLISNGIELIIVTGRHPDLTRSIHYKLGLKTPVIGCNGGIIKDLNTNEILFKNVLSANIIKQAIEISKELGVNWVVYEKDNIFYKDNPPKSYSLPYKNSQFPENLRANFVKINTEEEMFERENVFLKILLLFDNRPDLVSEGFSLLQKIGGVEVVRSADTYVDVMAFGSSKGKAIEKYLSMIDVTREEIAAMGDAQNDVDMIEFARVGIAVGNAVKSVKEVAQYITRDVPKGLEDAVEHLIKLSK